MLHLHVFLMTTGHQILRARGLFRHQYEGRTLRDHYGLPRPPSQHAAGPVL